MGYQRQRERWVYRHPLLARLLGMLSGAATAGCAAGTLVVVSGPPPEHEFVTAPPPATALDAEVVSNAAHCEKGADTFGDVAQAVSEAGGLQADGVVSELQAAEARMTRRAAVPSERLTETFGEAEGILRDLRHAIEDGDGVDPALDDTLELMDTLGQQCHEVLLSGGRHHSG